MFRTNVTTIGLPNLGLQIRTLFTGFILVIGIGLMMSGAQILLTHGMADGKYGVSIDDIVYSYHGNAGNSTIEAKLKGSMQDKASMEVKREIIQWVQQGASRNEWDDRIGAHFQHNCIRCHSVIPGLPNFTTYEGVLPLAAIDTGESVDRLARVSHIHLFGIAFIFFFVGYIFYHAVGISPLLQSVLILTPFLFLILDVLSWWLTKWYPSFALLTLIGGIGYAVAVGAMLITSLYQMWLMPPRAEELD